MPLARCGKQSRLTFWLSAGAGLVVPLGAVTCLSRGWLNGATGGRTGPALVALLCLAGVAYIAVLCRLRHSRPATAVSGVLVVGLLMRAAVWPSLPLFETDYYRYLWDGGVSAHGLDPYLLAPAEVRKELSSPSGKADARPYVSLARGAPGARKVLRHINHPDLRTIYPPVAQAFFALGYWLTPWRLAGWKALLALADVAGLALLWVLLKGLSLPTWQLAVYWLNPLLVKEVYNSAHMDVLLVPFVLVAALTAVRAAPVRTSSLLALATGIKVWPGVLLPLFIGRGRASRRRAALAFGIFVAICALLMAPQLAAMFGANSGLLAYGRRWEMNDALFMLILWAAQGTAALVGWGAPVAGLVARGVAVLLLVIVMAYARSRPTTSGADMLARALWVVAAVFLLSPTQFPWYYIWVLPFLAVRPLFSLLCLTVLLPLYYLRFFFEGIGAVGYFDYGVVWAEYVPVWALLLWEIADARARAAAPAMPEEAP